MSVNPLNKSNKSNSVQPTDAQITDNAQHQAIADAYDSVPYQSMPFFQSSPEQMAVMAKLFGLNPPDIRNARVLELGCSAGGNLIPLAAKYPGITAIGIDISKVQIDEGLGVIKQTGITNCSLLALDIVKAQDQIKGQFDYIVCHGVFSWVPEAVRHAILDVVRDRLAPTGVAYMSYNVYPGWKTREVIREMMMFHSSGCPTPAEKLVQAKAIVDYITNINPEQSTYGKLLRDEATRLATTKDYYLHHEYLEIENNPMYFRDFIALAQQRKLAYLGESNLIAMTPQRLGKDISETLMKLSGGNILATQQYMDFFTNRAFRQTLLVHEAQAATIRRGIGPKSMREFSISTTLVPDPQFNAVAGQLPLAQYIDRLDRRIGINTVLMHELVKLLVATKPSSISFANIVAQLKTSVQDLAANTEEAIMEAVGGELLNLLSQDVIKLNLDEMIVPPLSTQPVAYTLARAQAQLGQNWVTNLMHQSVGLTPAHAAVLALLDGTRDHAALQTELLIRLKDGRLNASRGQERITAETELTQLAAQLCQQMLHDLRQQLVLIA